MTEDVQVNSTHIDSINTGAGFWIRALARFIDLIFGWVVGIFSGIFTGILLAILAATQVIGVDWAEKISGMSIAAFILSLLGSLFYEVICEGFYGATLGKLICRLRVLSQDANPCGVKAALIRNLAFYIDVLFFGLVAYSSMSKTPLKQRYGDRWGKTIVVRTHQVPDRSKKPGGVFISALLIGSGIWGALIALSLILEAL